MTAQDLWWNFGTGSAWGPMKPSALKITCVKRSRLGSCSSNDLLELFSRYVRLFLSDALILAHTARKVSDSISQPIIPGKKPASKSLYGLLDKAESNRGWNGLAGCVCSFLCRISSEIFVGCANRLPLSIRLVPDAARFAADRARPPRLRCRICRRSRFLHYLKRRVAKPCPNNCR